MTSRIGFIALVFMIVSATSVHSQDEVIKNIDEAKQLYLDKNFIESVNYLNHALKLINTKLLAQIETLFPEPLKKWRQDQPFSRMTKTAYATSLISRCKYYRKGGGQSVEIEIQTNAPRIANVKMAFVNPLMVRQLGKGARISSVDDQSCIERYDAIDKFAELIFVPTSNVMVTIRGYEMKNTKITAQFARKMKWDLLSEIFP